MSINAEELSKNVMEVNKASLCFIRMFFLSACIHSSVQNCVIWAVMSSNHFSFQLFFIDVVPVWILESCVIYHDYMQLTVELLDVM